MSHVRTATVDTERIALSLELGATSERFALEATLWRLPEAKNECERVARYLGTLSRTVITEGDIDTIRAYADASRLLIDNVVGTRRFFHTIVTPYKDLTP